MPVIYLHFLSYEDTETGLLRQPVVFKLDPDNGFTTSPVEEDDWTLVRVRDDANRDWGAIDLEPTDVSVRDLVTLIHHPAGGPKRIALFHNMITYVDKSRVQYV